MYSYKIEQAIKAAALLHAEQLRKGPISLPYVTHVYSVMMILRDYTDDENTLVSALLHDTLEDTDYTFDELKVDFGEDVANIVSTLTEPKAKGQELNWLENKKGYAKQLRTGPIEAVMVAAADKAHNFRCTVEDYFDDHDGFLRDYGTYLDTRIEAYQNIANAINNRLPDGIVHEFNHTFKAYKDFIFDVKEKTS
jgi:myo-inositol-1(or 4)-monophosphatase